MPTFPVVVKNLATDVFAHINRSTLVQIRILTCITLGCIQLHHFIYGCDEFYARAKNDGFYGDDHPASALPLHA